MITIIDSADMTGRNTFGLRMTADTFVEYTAPDDLAELSRRGVFGGPWLHIGVGSNLLFATERYRGTVLHSAIRSVTSETSELDGDVVLRVGAGVTLDQLAEHTAARGWYGLENLSGIPGEAGAGAVQNVGAYGVELSDRIVSVTVFDTLTGEPATLEAGECGYGYRSSRFKCGPDAGRFIVTEVSLRLTSRCSPVLIYGPLTHLPADATPSAVRAAVLAVRDSKLPDPARHGSAGSYFKNPVVSLDEYEAACSRAGQAIPAHETTDGRRKLSAAWLIDKAGLKGESCGGAALWPGQPLVIYNTGCATSADVIALRDRIVCRVSDVYGITLYPEVQQVDAV